jgi:TolB-like protein
MDCVSGADAIAHRPGLPLFEQKGTSMRFASAPKTSMITLVLVLLMAAVCVTGLSAEDKQVKIAFVKIENRSMDPRYDYLEGILSGTLLFDLAGDPGILIVDRSSLDAILREQELALSDLADATKAVRVGKVLGADYLLKGQYVFMGTEVMVSLSLVEVETAKTLPFNERGATENLIHGLAEKIIERLTGRTTALRSADHERSIISLKDEKPGTITLYCNLIRAEIFLDDEFVAYTTGDATQPSLLPDIRPGKHIVRVRLRGFGVVKEPEITFSDWQETVDVKPGKNHVVRATITHLGYRLYDIMKLLVENATVVTEDFKKPFTKKYQLGFTDRAGAKHDIALQLELIITPARAELKALLTYDGAVTALSSAAATGKRDAVKKTINAVEVTLEVDYDARYRCRIEYRVHRTDLTQDMWTTGE